MQSIKKLDPLTISQIAAGEVIESPAGVVKELVENSLDAGAREIRIFATDAGYREILITDDGSGISREDLPLVLESFATSKLEKIHDLGVIKTMGFRGEALGAIRSVSQVSVESIRSGESRGAMVQGSGDTISDIKASQIPRGTRIKVENLFFNVPVRREFASDRKKIRRQIIEVITAAALANPGVHFYLDVDQGEVLDFPAVEYRQERLGQAFGSGFLDGLLALYHEEEIPAWRNTRLHVEGFVSNFDFYRSNPSLIKFFINKRIIHYKKIVGIFRNVYGELLPPNRFPAGFLFLDMDPQWVDVNIHPQKKEASFRDEGILDAFLRKALRTLIESPHPIRAKKLARPSRRSEDLAFHPALHPMQSLEFHPSETRPAPERQNPEDNQEMDPLTHALDGKPMNISPPPVSQSYTGVTDTLPPSSDPEPSTVKEIKSGGEFTLPRELHTRLFNTFILGSSEEGIFLIDQHTAHERINYEAFKRKLSRGENLKQMLLAPQPIVLSPADKDLIRSHGEVLGGIGFEWEDMGPAGFVLLSVPHYLSPGETETAFFHCLRILKNTGTVTPGDLFDALAKNLSCKASITAGYDNSLENMKLLLEELRKCDEPHRCPHGRPTVVYLGREDVFHFFKRTDQRFK